jgi:hypothetical protein
VLRTYDVIVCAVGGGFGGQRGGGVLGGREGSGWVRGGAGCRQGTGGFGEGGQAWGLQSSCVVIWTESWRIRERARPSPRLAGRKRSGAARSGSPQRSSRLAVAATAPRVGYTAVLRSQ